MTVRVLVTGATGFVGQHLCHELAANGIPLRAFVRRDAHTSLPPDAEFVPGEITDEAAVRAAVRDIDVIVHLAARVHVMHDDAADPLAEFTRVNVEGTRILVRAASDSGVKHVVFASSVKAVGDVSVAPWTSITPPRPTDPYGVSKLEAERLLLARPSADCPAVTVLRFPLLYGPGMKGNMLRLFRIIDRGWPVPVGTMDNSRSMLFVGNAVAAILRIIRRVTEETSAGAHPGPLFVADGPGQSTAMLVRDIATALQTSPRTLRLPEQPMRTIARFSGPVTRGRLSAVLDRLFGSLEVDHREFEREYNFRPPYTREQGLEITARWFLQS